jgi:hypothetical protein
MRAGLATVALHDGIEPVFLLLAGGRRGMARLIGLDLSVRELSAAEIATATRARLEAPLLDEIDGPSEVSRSGTVHAADP